MDRTWAILAVAGMTALLACFACKREERKFRVSPSSAETPDTVKVTDLQPGLAPTNPPVKNEYEENAAAMSEGQHLYEAFNCVGCHAHGGGDKGPALMDDKWIYGSRPEQIFATIAEGRPNGMPAFGSKITKQQIWEIVAYVRSLSGLASKGAAPGREDHMQTGKPPSSVQKQQPKDSSTPGPTP